MDDSAEVGAVVEVDGDGVASPAALTAASQQETDPKGVGSSADALCEGDDGPAKRSTEVAQKDAAEPVSPMHDTAARESAIWEVRLAGEFVPFEAADQKAIELAYARGESCASVRHGEREVALTMPFVQRAAPGRPECRVRPVRRRVEAAVAPPASSDRRNGSTGALAPNDFLAGQHLRIRFTRWDEWVTCVVQERRVFEDAGGLVQHRVHFFGAAHQEDWIDLTELASYEAV